MIERLIIHNFKGVKSTDIEFLDVLLLGGTSSFLCWVFRYILHVLGRYIVFFA